MSGWQGRPPADDDATVVLRRPGLTPPHPMSIPSAAPFGLLLRLVRWTSLVLAVVFALTGGVFALSTRDFLSRAVPADGAVLRLAERDGAYVPVFQFRTQAGQTVEVIHSVSSNPPMWRAGQAVRILYDRQDPLNASPDDWWSIWLFPIVFGGAALLPLAGFVVLSILARRRKAAPAR